MADWGKGASSKKRTSPPELKYRYANLTCSKCGRFWMFRYLYDSDMRQVHDDYGNVLCQKCRREAKEKSMVRKASPPPKSLQMRIEDIYGTKK